MVVCDKELGLYEKFPGLSATSVSAAAFQLGLPFCQYSREAGIEGRALERLKRLSQWDSEDITLQGQSPSDWAVEAAGLFRGFAEISASFERLDVKDRVTPASTLASILERPHLESKLALYGSGDQLFLREVFPFYDPQSDSSRDLLDRLPRLLGMWLRLSILRFPGILVDSIAAASYLNIAVDQFLEPAYEVPFKAARYCGPFVALGKWWWRDELDFIVAEAGAEDGYGFLRAAGKDVRECPDPQTGERAGCYCMLTEEPVSRANSRGDIGWFPQGADLARVRKDRFSELSSLVGSF